VCPSEGSGIESKVTTGIDSWTEGTLCEMTWGVMYTGLEVGGGDGDACVRGCAESDDERSPGMIIGSSACYEVVLPPDMA
jgi:hypothetical protein